MEERPATTNDIPAKPTYSFLTKYAQPSQRAFGDNITNVSVQQHAKTAPSSGKHVDDVFATPATRPLAGRAFDETNDPASSGKLLAKQLGEVAKTLATPIERKTIGGRRCSILSDELQTSILDLSGFDAQGERRRQSLSTPLIVNGKDRIADARSRSMLGRQSNPAVATTRAEEAKVAELLSQRDEMMSILEGYQGTIAKMSDEYSRDACAWTSENKLLKTEVERLRQERQQVHEQFTVLYESKYVPLKEHAKNLEMAVAASTSERTRAADADALRAELSVVRGECEKATAEVAEKQQEIERLKEQLRQESMLKEKIHELTRR
jgi:chromosome segregation ATPase